MALVIQPVVKELGQVRPTGSLHYGYEIIEETLATDEESDIVSHRYFDQVGTDEELEALKPDNIQVDWELDARRLDLASDVFKDIFPVKQRAHTGRQDGQPLPRRAHSDRSGNPRQRSGKPQRNLRL